jgi:hypothetical protein
MPNANLCQRKADTKVTAYLRKQKIAGVTAPPTCYSKGLK